MVARPLPITLAFGVSVACQVRPPSLVVKSLRMTFPVLRVTAPEYGGSTLSLKTSVKTAVSAPPRSSLSRLALCSTGGAWSYTYSWDSGALDN